MVLYDERRNEGAPGSHLTEYGLALIGISPFLPCLGGFSVIALCLQRAWRSGWNRHTARFPYYLHTSLSGFYRSLSLQLAQWFLLRPSPSLFIFHLLVPMLPANTPILCCLTFLFLGTDSISALLPFVFCGFEIIASEEVSSAHAFFSVSSGLILVWSPGSGFYQGHLKSSMMRSEIPSLRKAIPMRSIISFFQSSGLPFNGPRVVEKGCLYAGECSWVTHQSETGAFRGLPSGADKRWHQPL